MSPAHPLSDLAWKFNDILRVPKAREWVLGQSLKHIQMKGQADQEGLPWRNSPFEDNGEIVVYLTIPEKCTFLLILHNIVCSGEEQKGPAPWPEWRRDNQSQTNGIHFGLIASHLSKAFREEHRDHIEGWLKDIEFALKEEGIVTSADAGSKSLEPALGGKSANSLIQRPEGLPLSLSVHQAPAGVPAFMATAYSQLVLPLLVAESFLQIPKGPTPGADLLQPCAEALEAAWKQAEKFLDQEEIRLRAEAPGVFEIANEILDFTKALVVELPSNRAWIEEAIAANSPPEEVQGRIRESRERLAEKCREYRGPDPVRTLVSLVDRLRTAISQWAADIEAKPPSTNNRIASRRRLRP